MSNSFLLLFVLGLCMVTGALAARKGYNFFLWVLAGGIIGLVVLAFLPFVNRGGLSDIEVREKTKTGNIIGAVFTAIGLVQIVPRLLLLLVAASTPKMSGVYINGRQLTQAEWDQCGHNDIACITIEAGKHPR